VLLIVDRGEIPCQLETHALTLRHFRWDVGTGQPVEEPGDRHTQHLGDFVQAPRRNTVQAALVLVGLLIGHADQLGELLLRQSQHDPPLADPRTDMVVGSVRPRAGPHLGLRRNLAGIGGVQGGL